MSYLITEVQCEDTVSGPKCGPCPHGFLGDGVNCTKPIICAAEPCYPGNLVVSFNYKILCGIYSFLLTHCSLV